MSIAISNQMMQGLVALTSMNDDITKTQNRLSSGKAISQASDNISVYFKAKTFSDKADAYDVVNAGITEAVSNLDTVDKAMTNMTENLKGALQMMTDARSKPTSFTLNVSTSQGAVVAQDTDGPSGNVNTLKGVIVGKSIGSGSDNASVFQQGDVFAVTFGAKTAYFRASATTVAPSDSAMQLDASNTWKYVNATDGSLQASATGALAADGRTAQSAYNFNDLTTLGDKLTKAFGDDLGVTVTPSGTGSSTTYSIALNVKNSNTVSFQSVSETSYTSGGNATDNFTFDFSALFGKQADFKLDAAGQISTNGNGVPNTVSAKLDALQGNQTVNTLLSGKPGSAGKDFTGNSFTYSARGAPPATVSDSLDARRDAASMYRQSLNYLKTTSQDASLPGYANVLNGETLTVNLNDTGSVKQLIKLGKATDPTSLGISGFKVAADGTITTTNSATDFNNDSALDAAITEIKNALSSIKKNQTYLAAAKIQVNSRLDYNKLFSTTLKTDANAMTAADTTQEGANLAALQNRQSFATNNMVMTKQAEQSMLQLLR